MRADAQRATDHSEIQLWEAGETEVDRLRHGLTLSRVTHVLRRDRPATRTDRYQVTPHRHTTHHIAHAHSVVMPVPMCMSERRINRTVQSPLHQWLLKRRRSPHSQNPSLVVQRRRRECHLSSNHQILGSICQCAREFSRRSIRSTRTPHQ